MKPSTCNVDAVVSLPVASIVALAAERSRPMRRVPLPKLTASETVSADAVIVPSSVHEAVVRAKDRPGVPSGVLLTCAAPVDDRLSLVAFTDPAAVDDSAVGRLG